MCFLKIPTEIHCKAIFQDYWHKHHDCFSHNLWVLRQGYKLWHLCSHINFLLKMNARLKQLVASLTAKQEVTGSVSSLVKGWTLSEGTHTPHQCFMPNELLLFTYHFPQTSQQNQKTTSTKSRQETFYKVQIKIKFLAHHSGEKKVIFLNFLLLWSKIQLPLAIRRALSQSLTPVHWPVVETSVTPIHWPVVEIPVTPIHWPVVQTPVTPVHWPVVETPVTLVHWPVVQTPVTPIHWPVVQTPVTPVHWPVVETPVTPIHSPWVFVSLYQLSINLSDHTAENARIISLINFAHIICHDPQRAFESSAVVL